MKIQSLLCAVVLLGVFGCDQSEPDSKTSTTEINVLGGSEQDPGHYADKLDEADYEAPTPSAEVEEARRELARRQGAGAAPVETSGRLGALKGEGRAGGGSILDQLDRLGSAKPSKKNLVLDGYGASSRKKRLRPKRRTVSPQTAIKQNTQRRVQQPTALPQNGVIASNFVGGTGVTARLDDLLDRGVMVDGEMVRLEAFQDREPLPYSAPSKEAMSMFAGLERSKLHKGKETVHLQVALLGKRGELPKQPKMDIRLLMDCSGSMRGQKWTDAIAAAHQLVDKLKSSDKFGLISYSSEAEWTLKPKKLGNKKAAHAAIDTLRFGGNTNIGAALQLVKEHYPSSAKNTVGQVILVSDGRATAGTMNARELGRAAREMFNDRGVLSTAIGLGTDFDETTMLEIAREGSGSYYFVRRSADIGEILTDELESRAQAVAQGLRVRVELGKGVVAKRIYGSRLLSESEHAAVRETEVAVDTRLAKKLGIKRTRKKEEEKGLRMHLPTFKRGDQHVILMELEVPAGSTSKIAKVVLDYKDLTRSKNGTITREVTAERVSKEVASESTERLVKRTVLAFQAGDAMQNAATALSSGDPTVAMVALKEQRELLVAAAGIWRDPALRKDAQLLSRYERVLNGAWNNLDNSSQNTLVLAMNYYADKRMR